MWNPFKKKEDFRGAPVMLERIIPKCYVEMIGKRNVNAQSEQEFANTMEIKIQHYINDGWTLTSVVCNPLNEFYAYFTK